MSGPGQVISLQTSLMVCKTLDQLLTGSFGPNSTHNLLSTATGKLMITSSGPAILQSLNLSHPVGRVIVNSAVSLHKITGDHTKSFVAILTEALHWLDEGLGSGNGGTGNSLDPRLVVERMALVKALTRIKLEILPEIQQALVKQMDRRESYEGVLQVCKDVLWTTFQGKFNHETTRKLTDLVYKCITESSVCVEDLVIFVQSMIDQFDLICVSSAGQSVLNSRILDGIVVQRTFPPGGATPADMPMLNVQMVLVKFSLENVCPTETESRIKVGSVTDIKQSLLYKVGHINRIIHILQKNKIELLLSVDFVSESTVLLFAQSGIHIIHSIDRVELESLSNTAQCHVACDASDLLDVSSVMASVERVEFVTAANRICTLIKLPSLGKEQQRERTMNLMKSLLICAPTPGLCDQFCATVLAAFKSLRLALSPSMVLDLSENGGTEKNHREPSVIEGKISEADYHHPVDPGVRVLVCPGGGAFEMFVHLMLKQYAESYAEHTSVASACKLLSHAFLIVPLRLLRNSYSSSAKGISIIDLYEVLQLQTPSPSPNYSNVNIQGGPAVKYLSIDGKSGKCTLKNPSVVESIAGKMLLTYHVVELLCQLLRVDYLVPVRRLPSTLDTADDG